MFTFLSIRYLTIVGSDICENTETHMSSNINVGILLLHLSFHSRFKEKVDDGYVFYYNWVRSPTRMLLTGLNNKLRKLSKSFLIVHFPPLLSLSLFVSMSGCLFFSVSLFLSLSFSRQYSVASPGLLLEGLCGTQCELPSI